MDHKIIGHSVPRMESEAKVKGTLKYLGDIKIPGMLHGKVLRSPIPHATIRSIDASRAAALPGIVGVLTRDDVIGNPNYESHYGPVLMDQTIVALDKVRYVGDPVAAVAAERADIAEEALALIDVVYDELPTLLTPEEALAPGAPLIHDVVRRPEEGFTDMKDVGPVSGTNICNHFHLQKGDIDAGFKEADLIFEDTFSVPATQHSAIESFTAIASFTENEQLTIWTTVQNPFVIRDQMAAIFHRPLSKVRVIAMHVGGGYGSKLYPKLEPICAALALKTSRPVGITLTREEVFLTITKHGARMHLKTGVKKDGTIIARKTTIYLDTGAYAEIGPRVSKKSGYTAAGPYETPHVLIDSFLSYTNRVPAGAFRGFGVSQSSWAHESQMDMIARALKMDPLELRLKNLLDDGGEFATGEHVHCMAMRECVEKVAAGIDWGRKSKPSGPNKARGKGFACLIKATITPSASSAIVRLNEDGSAHVYVGTVEIGQGSDTVMAQIAAEELRIPFDQVAVVHSDTDLTPYDLTTSSSRSTFHVGRAVQIAAQEVRAQLAAAAAAFFGAPLDDIVIEDQTIGPKNDASKRLTYRKFLINHFGTKGANIVGRGQVKTNTVDEKGEHTTSAFWFAGAGAAEVEVDLETGQVKVIQYVTAADVGKALNPAACRQQLEGAAITGIGQALLEELVYQDGLLINPNFLDYNLPRFLDMPEKIVSILVERPHPDGPFGAKGLGETGLIPAAPAIANAVEDAAGVRVKDLPITSEKVLKLLQEKRRGALEPAFAK